MSTEAKVKTFEISDAYRAGLAGMVCCSYCGLGCEDVDLLISTPKSLGLRAYICDRCVAVCVSLVVERAEKAEKPVEPPPES